MNKYFTETFSADLKVHKPFVSSFGVAEYLRYPVLRWQRRLRYLESVQVPGVPSNIFHRVIYYIVKYIHLRDSVRLGFTIPLHVFGPGLSIAHWGTITVEEKARVGRGCRIHQGVTIGSSKGLVPVIGDNCFIGANSSIIGGVILGDNVVVGAGAVVNKSFPDNAVLVGNPAKNIASS